MNQRESLPAIAKSEAKEQVVACIRDILQIEAELSDGGFESNSMESRQRITQIIIQFQQAATKFAAFLDAERRGEFALKTTNQLLTVFTLLTEKGIQLVDIVSPPSRHEEELVDADLDSSSEVNDNQSPDATSSRQADFAPPDEDKQPKQEKPAAEDQSVEGVALGLMKKFNDEYFVVLRRNADVATRMLDFLLIELNNTPEEAMINPDQRRAPKRALEVKRLIERLLTNYQAHGITEDIDIKRHFIAAFGTVLSRPLRELKSHEMDINPRHLHNIIIALIKEMRNEIGGAHPPNTQSSPRALQAVDLEILFEG